ncbi:MAG: 4-(cytidine 5'-diphospho)-2-C-methyl-D-erythritol kinase [Lachnospiraceae bacterium]|nr:4-(cytidine 5'-diphospho)-2-C-methyl-D-erythritol kinase [Lachnospiraceae bacterium]
MNSDIKDPNIIITDGSHPYQKEVRLSAHAKINLGLDTVRKREDGYHEVRMIMQSITLCDCIILRSFESEDSNSCNSSDNTDQKNWSPDGIRLCTVKGVHPDVPMNEENLIYRAILMLKKEFHIPHRIEAVLDKQIPVAAGMAGGSTDAAAAFKAMNTLFHLGLTDEELQRRAVRLGADIPYCILGGTALSEGIGEILTPLPNMPDCHILIAKPPINVSTAYVYKNLKANELSHHPDIDGMVHAIQSQDLNGIISRLENTLETVTIPDHPIIRTIKECMTEYGAEGTLMSGSGPTVFGIFTDEIAVRKAADAIRAKALSDQVYITRPVSNNPED